jgi:hypothetical protein
MKHDGLASAMGLQRLSVPIGEQVPEDFQSTQVICT